MVQTLLHGVEVEWKTLGEVCDIVTDFVAAGSFADMREKVKYLDTPDFAQLVRTTDLKNKFSNVNNFVYISESAFKFLWRVNLDKDYIILPNIGNCGEVYYLTPEMLPYRNNVLGPNAILIRSNVCNNRFLFFLFNIAIFQNQLYKITSQSGQTKFNKTELKKISIPIPPLSVQKEIVRILDTFTELTAELTAELTVRKKQYSYYREQLLSFDEGEVEWKTLGEIGEVRMCKRILKEQTSDTGEIPFYKIGTFGKEPNAYISKELFNEFKTKYNYPRIGEVLISASGTIGRAVIFDGRDAYFQDSNIVWIENDESQVLNKYLFYFYQIAKWDIAEGGTIQRLYNDNLKKTKIPIPPLKEQARIVSILDKFDMLTTSISEGLPKEIELRKKQYEYYRDLLLTFERSERG